MGSHHRKKYESESSENTSDSSSSEDHRSNKRKSSNKHKHSSDEGEIVQEPAKSKKGRYAETSEDSPDEKSRHRKFKRNDTSEERDVDYKSKKSGHERRHKSKHNVDKDVHKIHRHKDHSSLRSRVVSEVRHKKEHSCIEKSDNKERRENDEKLKPNKDRKADARDYRSAGRDRHNEKDRFDSRDKYDDRNRNNERDRHDDRDRNRKDDNRHSRSNEGGHRKDGEDKQRKIDSRRRRSSSYDHANAKWGKPENDSKSEKKDSQQKQKVNFGLSGKLTEETNTYRGIVIKYSEPPEARKPRRRWRLYPFKGEKALQTLYIHRESAYLIGRERKVVDLPVDHPSCSKQHAALQYRLVPFTRENGSVGKRVRPYLIDLESANGTFINNKKIEPKKYYELMEKDVIKFGFSSREYVLLHENSKDEGLDDDVKLEEEDEVKVKVKSER